MADIELGLNLSGQEEIPPEGWALGKSRFDFCTGRREERKRI